MSTRVLLLSVLVAAAPGAAQEPAPGPPPGSDPRAAWDRLCAATAATDVAGKEIRAFALRADVLTRDGARSNEFEADYRYLAPDLIRFRLESGRETGRAPGKGQGAYWLRDADEVVALQGREHAESRKLVDDMLAVARNFVALSDPSRLRISDLGFVEEPPLPPGLGGFRARHLVWLSFTSPDFALLGGDPPGASTPRDHRVLVGLDHRTDEPRIVVVREEAGSAARKGHRAAPMLFRLGNHQPVGGYRVPHTIFVHRLAAGSIPPVFEEKPWQEIWVRSVDLAPGLVEGDFEPRPRGR